MVRLSPCVCVCVWTLIFIRANCTLKNACPRQIAVAHTNRVTSTYDCRCVICRSDRFYFHFTRSSSLQKGATTIFVSKSSRLMTAKRREKVILNEINQSRAHIKCFLDQTSFVPDLGRLMRKLHMKKWKRCIQEFVLNRMHHMCVRISLINLHILKA